jgi:hypothetical protein
MSLLRRPLGTCVSIGSLLFGASIASALPAPPVTAQTTSVNTCSANLPAGADVVGVADASHGSGYWEVDQYGDVAAFGGATCDGSLTGASLSAPIVGIAGTPDGHGYWLAASDGGVFSFGDAPFEGSEGGAPLQKPIVGIAGTPDGHGYWLAASDGGVFSFGDAPFAGRPNVTAGCAIDQLSLSFGIGSRGGAQVSFPAVVMNSSNGACTVSGTPHVTLTTSTGQALPTHEAPSGSRPPIVVGAAGQASFTVIYADTDGSTDQTCQPTASKLTLSLSGESGSITQSTSTAGVSVNPCNGDITVTGFTLVGSPS